jgi:hypothetical protein
VDVLVGDATDTRWMDDAGAPHDTGWVIAWTGNNVVDQVAARWGEERFGAGHAVLWSNKPAADHLKRLDIAPEVEIGGEIDLMDRGVLTLKEAADPGSLARVLLWLERDAVKLAARGVEVPPPSEHRVYIGLARNGEGPARSN